MKIGEKSKKFRVAQGLSQKQLAIMSGMSEPRRAWSPNALVPAAGAAGVRTEAQSRHRKSEE